MQWSVKMDLGVMDNNTRPNVEATLGWTPSTVGERRDAHLSETGSGDTATQGSHRGKVIPSLGVSGREAAINSCAYSSCSAMAKDPRLGAHASR